MEQAGDLENLGGQVGRISEVLSARGLHVPVEGFLCMANRNRGLPLHRTVVEQMARDASVPLGAADVDRMLPALRTKAKAAAGGRVHGRGGP